MAQIIERYGDGTIVTFDSEAEYGPFDRELIEAEVRALAAIYWPAHEVDNAVNVCRLESDFHTGAWARIGEDSRGPWQINLNPLAHPDLAHWFLFDPQINAYFAHKIWVAAGNWAPWFNSATKLGLPGGG